jgi:hypothetical protein
MPTDSPAEAGPPPHVVALRLSTAYQISRAVHAATRLGVPDVIGGGARTFEEIAQEVWTGGRERTSREFEALLATAGLRLTRIITPPIPEQLIEAVPA